MAGKSNNSGFPNPSLDALGGEASLASPPSKVSDNSGIVEEDGVMG
ncbi:MAG: hypothetical protein WC862_00840 [Patescibacteria group bacterium]